jgi:hypothetical protein
MASSRLWVLASGFINAGPVRFISGEAVSLVQITTEFWSVHPLWIPFPKNGPSGCLLHDRHKKSRIIDGKSVAGFIKNYLSQFYVYKLIPVAYLFAPTDLHPFELPP